jgi:phosphoglycolate phosphatase
MKESRSLMKELNKTLIFDLDGTLLDSSYSVSKSLKISFEKNCPEYLDKIKLIKIGPRVPDLLDGLIPKKLIPIVTKDFRKFYDDKGYKDTKLYPSVRKILLDLKTDYDLKVVTNKPKNTSISILSNLSIIPMFSEIFSTHGDKYISKSDIVKQIINKDDYFCFIGDSFEDYKSSIDNDIDFVYCKYGYGEVLDTNIKKIDLFEELPANLS